MGEFIVGFLMVLGAVAAMVVTIIAALWAMVDAEDRGMRGWPVALFVLILHLPGLLLWLIFRPEKLSRSVVKRPAR
ncbi:MAG: hypothetical protein ACT4QC_21520 [Planctomycetaceae bacterium]